MCNFKYINDLKMEHFVLEMIKNINISSAHYIFTIYILDKISKFRGTPENNIYACDEDNLIEHINNIIKKYVLFQMN